MGELDDTGIGKAKTLEERVSSLEGRMFSIERVTYCPPMNAHGAITNRVTARPRIKGRGPD